MTMILPEVQKDLEILGSVDRSYPNLSLVPDHEFDAEGRVIVWRAFVPANPVRLRLSTQPQRSFTQKEDHMKPVQIEREGLTLANLGWRFVPLVGFVLVALLMVSIGDLQPLPGTLLLVTQIVLLIFAVRAWIPRQHPGLTTSSQKKG